MKTYKELVEKKLSQLNQQHVGTVKGLETAMHSQGIEPGKQSRDAHHVNYPNAKFKKSGKPATGITSVDNGKGKLTSSTGGVTVRDAVIKSGRVDKRPAAKAERAKEAAANKERKVKNRNPFTREEVTLTYSEFILNERISSRRLGELEAKGKGDAARRQMRADGTQPAQGNKEKARRAQQLSGGSLAKRTPADTGAMAVRSKGSPLAKQNNKMSLRDKNATAVVPTNQQRQKKTAVGQPKNAQRDGTSSGYMTKPDTKVVPNRSGAKRKPREERGGFIGGFQKGMGGDNFSPNLKKREKARQKTGQDFARGVRKTAGDAVSTVGKVVGGTAKGLYKGAQDTVQKGDGATGPDNVKGSSEIIRGRRG